MSAGAAALPEPSSAEEELAERGVSVVVPAFDAERTLRAAVASIRAQAYRPLEILVVDDASRDGTAEVARELAGADLRAIRLERNSGPAAARNRGIQLARGKYLAFLDADDLWLPGKLERQVPALEARPELVLVTCDSRYVSESGAFLRLSHECRPPASGADAWKTLLAYNFSPTPTVLVRRADVVGEGGFDPAKRFGEDLHLWIRLARRGEVLALPEVLVEIREWPGSVTGRAGEGEAECVLPFVERFVEEERARLTRGERRAILGRRVFDGAVSLLYSHHPRRSLALFVRALGLGYERKLVLRYLPRVALSMLSGGRYPRRDFGQ